MLGLKSALSYKGMLRITVLAIFSHPEVSIPPVSPQALKLGVVTSLLLRVALLTPKPAVPRPCNKSTRSPGQGPLWGQRAGKRESTLGPWGKEVP